MRTNRQPSKIQTHEGGTASRCNKEEQLRRSVLACMLWEDNFYEDGESVADRIINTIPHCSPEFVSDLAAQARSKYYLRHAPLWMCVGLSRLGSLTAETLASVIRRADELTEFLSLYWKEGRCPVSAQVKKGLALAFGKFDEYQLAKYNRKTEVKLRDVLRIVHPKPTNKEQAELWGRLMKGELKTPDTWEVALSAGKTKKETFTRLMEEGRLGYMALLRNLRNMKADGVDKQLVADSLLKGAARSKALPTRFMSAARAVPGWEDIIEPAMLASAESLPKIEGLTRLVVDVSGSMVGSPVSRKSQLDRLDAAFALSILCREVCRDIEIYSFSGSCVEVPPRRGFALADAIDKSQLRGCTYLTGALNYIKNHTHGSADRLIIITDEQSHDGYTCPPGLADKVYILNVATYKNGVGYGNNTIHINGWSEAVIKYITALESSE